MNATVWAFDWNVVKWSIEKILVPLVLPLLVYMYAKKQLVVKRHVEFLERQLTEFYAPMLALRKRIESHIGYTEKLKDAHGAAWYDVVSKMGDSRDPEEWDAAFEPYQRNLDSSNEGTANRLPLHCQMRDLFAEKFAYADSDVRRYFTMFDAFVEGLERYEDAKKNKTAALEAIELLIQPRTLEPFFELLERRVEEIQAQILKD